MSDPEISPQLNPQPEPPGGPVMSTPQTLTSIYFEPTSTFQALKLRPRFLIAGLITVIVFMAYYATFEWRVGSEAIIRAQVESRQPDASPEQIEQAMAMQNNPIIKAVTYAAFPLVFAIMFAAGAGLYLLGATLMGKTLTFKQALSLWVYSTYPPTVIFALINILLLFLKSKDDIDPTAVNSGIARANPSLFVDTKTQPVLATVLGSFDLISFYGLFLAAIGLKVMAKLSSGSAWAIVLAIWLVGVILRIIMSLAFGQAY
ncbi:MAG TPA: YIP1 family protein [Pyrinomonadaceae bacterium]|nr:YIP1 family protein [Pyrinomonadaceae bacterium]